MRINIHTYIHTYITVRLLQGHCANTLLVTRREMILCLNFCRNEASDDAALRDWWQTAGRFMGVPCPCSWHRKRSIYHPPPSVEQRVAGTTSIMNQPSEDVLEHSHHGPIVPSSYDILRQRGRIMYCIACKYNDLFSMSVLSNVHRVFKRTSIIKILTNCESQHRWVFKKVTCLSKCKNTILFFRWRQKRRQEAKLSLG